MNAVTKLSNILSVTKVVCNSRKEFENIVIKSLPDGEVLRLNDIAEIQLDRLGYNFTNRVNGQKAVTCIVYQMAGTNATQTISDIQALLDEASQSLPAGFEDKRFHECQRLLVRFNS